MACPRTEWLTVIFQTHFLWVPPGPATELLVPSACLRTQQGQIKASWFEGENSSPSKALGSNEAPSAQSN